MTAEREKVVVAMSGGVDSSVAAALLLERGYQVIGATLLLRPCSDPLEATWCCGAGANDSARAVSGQLGIPHHSVECSGEFEEMVLRPAWDQYAAGRTPSPCIHCNRHIKLGLLSRLAGELGAQWVATGHYARISAAGVISRGLDASKDQSYFLFSLTEQQRRHALFPLGDLTKEQVRHRALELGLASAKRPESQDACFALEDGGFSEALRQKFEADARPGPIVDRDGIELGRHGGIHLYTVGQRKGLGVAMGRRAYVSRIDASTGTVVLTDVPEDIESHELEAVEAVWHGETPAGALECTAQIRYRSPAAAATVTSHGERVTVVFKEAQRAVAPGQAVVFYDGDRVLGGAWIDSTPRG